MQFLFHKAAQEFCEINPSSSRRAPYLWQWLKHLQALVQNCKLAHQPMGEMETCIFHDLPFCLDKYLREFELQICNLMNLGRILPS